MTCRCTGKSGTRKRLYRSRRHATTTAIYRGWIPTTYACPGGGGFHLTHPRDQKQGKGARKPHPCNSGHPNPRTALRSPHSTIQPAATSGIFYTQGG